MAAKAIIRVSKLKAGDLAGVEKHNLRFGDVEPNVDPARSHLNRYIKSSNHGLKYSIDQRIRNVGITRKVRPDAVLGIEVMMTASPDFFDDEMRAGRSEKLDAWIADSVAYLNALAGDPANVVQLVVHMDETTPHIQAVFVPISDDAPSKKSERKMALNAKPWTSPGKWQRMWTTYATAMAKYGLQRGELRPDDEPPKQHTSLKAGRIEVMRTAEAAKRNADNALRVVATTVNETKQVLQQQEQALAAAQAVIVRQEGVIAEQAQQLQQQHSIIDELLRKVEELRAFIQRLTGGGNNRPNQSAGQPPDGATRRANAPTAPVVPGLTDFGL